jgi:hypothetical protein
VRIALAALVALGAPLAAAAMTTSPGTRNVRCDESIAATEFPYVGSSRPKYRYRSVLGAAAAPPAFLEQVVDMHEGPWRYWRKVGIVIRAGVERVTIAVPREWRSRAAISWGNGGHGVFSSVRFRGCGSNPSSGNAYAGGFYLTSRSACLPLLFRVGTRTATVRFGIGRRCR